MSPPAAASAAPTPASQPRTPGSEAERVRADVWVCESCGFVYDPAEGDPDGGIPPGTAFADIPDDWFCPVCGARKSDFKRYEE